MALIQEDTGCGAAEPIGRAGDEDANDDPSACKGLLGSQPSA
jgi:hypothetical protein